MVQVLDVFVQRLTIGNMFNPLASGLVIAPSSESSAAWQRTQAPQAFSFGSEQTTGSAAASDTLASMAADVLPQWAVAVMGAGLPAVAGHLGRLAGTALCAPLFAPAAPFCGAAGAYAATLGASAASQYLTGGHVNWKQSRGEAAVGALMGGAGRAAELGIAWTKTTHAAKALASFAVPWIEKRGAQTLATLARTSALVATNGATGNAARAAQAYLTADGATPHTEKLQAATRELTDAKNFWVGGLLATATQTGLTAAGQRIQSMQALQRVKAGGAVVVKRPYADLSSEEKLIMKKFVEHDRPALDTAVATRSPNLQLNIPRLLKNEHGALCVDGKGQPLIDFKAMHAARSQAANDVRPKLVSFPLAEKFESSIDPKTDVERLASLYVTVRMLHRPPQIPPGLDVPRHIPDLPFIHLKRLEQRIDAMEGGSEVLNLYVKIAFELIEDAKAAAAKAGSH